MVVCYDCKGKGYLVSFNKESECMFCEGMGELSICDSFALPPRAVLSFRNQKCYKCGVKENDHNVAAIVTEV